jgi:3'-phosphoadenosine 5'-phosphosulfate sulfotransferase (PAPS reductase)/FAD synthetase
MSKLHALSLEYEKTYSPLTILSFGGGQDSTTILYKLVFDADFKAKYAPRDLLVLMADTGNEHPETYSHVRNEIVPFCQEHGIEFLFIDNSMGYHGTSWQSLTQQWREGNKPTIGSLAYPKTCTHNLKLIPQYRYVEEWLPGKYNSVVNKGRKNNYVQFAKYYGVIRWLVGIAKGEESRVADADKETALWKKQAVEVIYPLIEIGYDRQACQDYMREVGKEIPMPSNCMYCPFASNHMEILWLEKTYPDKFEEWIELEQAKLDAHKDADKNLGVSGRLHKEGDRKGQAFTLKDLLKEAKVKYPNVTLNQLNEYKWSHGHCVSSKY